MTWKNQIKVELLPDLCAGSDLSIANVARVSFDKWKTEQDSSDDRLIKYLANHKHSSPFRHTSVGIRCTAPIWLARQLVKHQAGLSWNEVSRRYVDAPVELFNQEFRARPDGGIKQGSGEVITSIEGEIDSTLRTPDGMHHSIRDIMNGMLEWYDNMVAQGVAPETVRGYMPLNMMTSWVWTGNLLAFHHMYSLRADAHAQVEAQHFANVAADVIKPMFPVAWDALSGVKDWEREQMMNDLKETKDG